MIKFVDVQRDFIQGKVLPSYILVGSERFLREELLGTLYKSFLGEEGIRAGVYKIDGGKSLAGVVQELQMPVLFTGGKRIAVIENPSYLLSGKKGDAEKKIEKDNGTKVLESFWERQCSGGEVQGIVVFCVDEVDKRRRIYRFLDRHNAVVDCSPLKGAALSKWVRLRIAEKGKTISGAAVESLLISIGGNLYRIEHELEKIVTYMQKEDKEITLHIIDKIVYATPQANIFKLVDALGTEINEHPYKYLHELFSLREPPARILYMIARHFRLLLQARCLQEEGVPVREAASSLQVQPFVAGKLYSQCRNFSRKMLSELLCIIQKTDLQMKTGKIEAHAAIELLICHIYSIKPSAGRR